MVSNSTTEVCEHIIIKWLVGFSFVWILQGPFSWNYKLTLHFFMAGLIVFGLPTVGRVRDKWTPRPPSIGWEGGCVIFFFPLQRTGIFASIHLCKKIRNDSPNPPKYNDMTKV